MPIAHGSDDAFTPDDYRAHALREAAMLAMIPALRLAVYLDIDPAEFSKPVYTLSPLSSPSMSAQLAELNAVAALQLVERIAR